MLPQEVTIGQPLSIAQGDRREKQNGLTSLMPQSGPTGSIAVTSWEIKQVGACEKCCLALRCSVPDTSRAYLYIRNNGSLEANDTNGIRACGSCCCDIQDNIRVEYFDRSPYSSNCNVAPFPCCLPYFATPKLEVIDHGYMCCCVKVDLCCRGKETIVMPFEQLPPPCCCCSNRTSACDNCFGLCGPPVGNPKLFGRFSPQPHDAQSFVNAAQAAMSEARPRSDMMVQRMSR